MCVCVCTDLKVAKYAYVAIVRKCFCFTVHKMVSFMCVIVKFDLDTVVGRQAEHPAHKN